MRRSDWGCRIQDSGWAVATELLKARRQGRFPKVVAYVTPLRLGLTLRQFRVKIFDAWRSVSPETLLRAAFLQRRDLVFHSKT